MPLDLTSLRDAVNALESSVEVSSSDAAKADTKMWEVLRAGVIQNFEVTYELSWKFIQRWIRTNRTPEDADHPRTRKDLFRLAAQYGLINDPGPWFAYGEARNLTAHTYNSKQAETVYETAVSFVTDARNLYENLRKSND